MTTLISSKGQIVLPAEIRRRDGIAAGEAFAIERLVRRILCLPWDAPTGLRWAKVLADLRRRGEAMPVKDSLIAATALRHGLTVVTRNTRDFARARVVVVDPFA